MSAKKTVGPIDTRSWGYAEDFIPPTEHIRAARSGELSLGLTPPSTGVLTTLQFLARVLDARHAVVIGAGTGASGLALFAGMAEDSVVTVVDSEAQLTDETKNTFDEAGLARRRYRAISGQPLEVLGNLQSEAYDLVFVNGDKLEYVEYLAQATRLLRSGGVVVLHDVLWRNLVADDNNEDDETVIIREALQSVLETEEFTAALWPVGGGLLAAVKD